MAISKQHFAYADALITSAIREFAAKGKKARKAGMVSGAKSAERLSIAAAIKDDKKLRPNAPKSWNTATAQKAVRVIQDLAWKEASAAYKKVKRKKTHYLPPSNIEFGSPTMLAGLFAFGIKSDNSAAALSRRKFIAGVGVTALGVFVTSEARAENRSYIAAVKRGVKAYLAGKRASIEKAMAAAL